MLTFLSQWLGRWFGWAPGRGRAPALRALPPAADFPADSRRLPPLCSRARLQVATLEDDRDIPVAPVATHVGATAFVAGQGARIYSLDAFRSHPPRRPRCA